MCRFHPLGGKCAPALLALAVLLGLSASIQAAPVTFADFDQSNSTGSANDNLFSYTESGVAGSGGTATLSATSIPVTFYYSSVSGLPAALDGPQAATLTLTNVTTNQAVTTEPFGATTFAEDVFPAFPGTTVTDTLTLTRTTPFNGLSNLLTLTFTGELLAGLNGYTAQLTGQTASPFNDTVSYSSSFLNFGSPTAADYSLSFTSWTTTADGNGVEQDTASSLLKSATAAGTGNFDVQSAPTVSSNVPEPAATAVGAICGVMMLKRRLKRSR